MKAQTTKTLERGDFFSIQLHGQRLRVYLKRHSGLLQANSNPYFSTGLLYTGQNQALVSFCTKTAFTRLQASGGQFTRENFAELFKKLLTEHGAVGVSASLSLNKSFTYADIYKSISASQKRKLGASTYTQKIEGLFYNLLKPFMSLTASKTNFATCLAQFNCNHSDKRRFLKLLEKALRHIGTDLAHTLAGMCNEVIDEIIRDESSLETLFCKRSFSEEEMLLVLKHSWKLGTKSLRSYVRLAFLTGMRVSELLGLQFLYVDFLKGEIAVCQQFNRVLGTISKTKTGKTRYFRFGLEVRNILMNLALENNTCGSSGFVISTTGGKKPIPYHVIERHWERVMLACEVDSAQEDFKRLKLSSTRHTFVNLALDSGKYTDVEIAYAVGHSPTTAKEHYKDYSKSLSARFD